MEQIPLVIEQISKEEFQRRIRQNFPWCWDENGNFKYEGLCGFSRDGNHIVWHSNPEYMELKRDSTMEALRDRTVKVDVPLLTWREVNAINSGPI